MSNLIKIRRRIKSAKNISQITKALEMVSASKMRKAQSAALASRPFTDKLRDVIGRVATSATSVSHQLAEIRPQNKVLVFLISTNKGLCGGLNVNLHRHYSEFISGLDAASISVVTVGKKARWMVKDQSIDLLAKFDDLKESVSFEESRTLATFAIESFTSGQFDAVYIAYPQFITTLTSEINVKKLLPITEDSHGDDHSESHVGSSDYLIEPNKEELVNSLMPYQVEMTLYQTILEARATEHSSRMVAMKNASDNAHDLIGSLTLDYNQARQSAVTNELLDVTTARMALE